MSARFNPDDPFNPRTITPNRPIRASDIHNVPGFEHLCWAEADLKKGGGGDREIIKYLGKYVQDFGHTLTSNGGIQFEHGFISRNVSHDTVICPTECRSRSRSGSKSPKQKGGRRVTKKARKYSRRR